MAERDRKAQTILEFWQGNNLNQDGLKAVLDELENNQQKNKKTKVPAPLDETQKDWDRLALFMSQQK